MAHRHTASRLVKCDGRAFTKEQYPVLARVYPTLRLPDLRGEFIRGWDDGRKVDTGRKLLSAQGATLLRTAMLDYYNQDTTGTSGIVGMGFNNEDSITDLREGSFKMPDGTTFSDPVVAMSDNGMQATILTSIEAGMRRVSLSDPVALGELHCEGSLMSNTAVLDENGIATVAGDITVYHYDEETREYTSSSVEYLALGVGTPAIRAPMHRRKQFRVTWFAGLPR